MAPGSSRGRAHGLRDPHDLTDAKKARPPRAAPFQLAFPPSDYAALTSSSSSDSTFSSALLSAISWQRMQ